MSRRELDLESGILAMFAALPLYATQSISIAPVALFHVVMALVLSRIVLRRGFPNSLHGMLNVAAAFYVLFFPIDALAISRSLIRSSTHLLLFIAIYQTVEASRRRNDGARALVTFLLFITSVATATHITIVLFIVGFAFLLFRQLMHLSHQSTEEDLGISIPEPPSTRAALASLLPTILIAALFFPFLPRVHNPFVRGIGRGLSGSSTGMSESIDFSDRRSISDDPTVVARVWMSRDALPFFTPLRLRGPVYQYYSDGQWRMGRRYFRPVNNRLGVLYIGERDGFARKAVVQQRLTYQNRYMLYIPDGTYAIEGLPSLFEAPARGVYSAPTVSATRGLINYETRMSRQVLPLRDEEPRLSNYPIRPEVAALARQIIGRADTAAEAAAKIEVHLSTQYRYVADPAALGRAVSLDDFLLTVRAGHCEYFAAGMVALLNSLGIPARIVGGFYGGTLNPLTGYFVVRLQDAHAWVEMWDGTRWRTYDPTPPSLRPGNAAQGLVRMYATAIGDSINYFWDRYVLTYGLGDQIAFAWEILQRARFTFTAAKNRFAELPDQLLSFDFLVVLLVSATLVVLAMRFSRRRRTTLDELLLRLGTMGVEVTPSTTASELMARIERERPEIADEVRVIVEVYLREAFSSRPVSKQSRLRAREALSMLSARA